jgi:hypothetical protein
MRLLRGLLLLCWGLAGCASGPEPAGEPANYGINKEGLLWVRGPWEAIKPSRDPDEVIDQLCPAVMQLPGAQFGDYGREYCGLVYSLGDTYYASHPSPLADTHAVPFSREKTSPMSRSRLDRAAKTQVFSIRIQFDKACHVQKLIPYLNEDRPGELYERRGKTWKLIGLIQSEHKASGEITFVND